MVNKEVYREICAGRKDIPLFAQPWWLDVVAPDWDAVIGKMGDQVIGIWPFTIHNKANIRFLRSPLLTPYLGPVVLFPPDLAPRKQPAFELDVLEALSAQIPHAQVWNLALAPTFQSAGVFKRLGLDVHVQQTFLLDLDCPVEELLANTRDNVRRSLKSAAADIKVENRPDAAKELFSFYAHTLGRKNRENHISFDLLQRAMTEAQAQNATALWAATDSSGQALAFVWTVWDNNNCYYLMGAQHPTIRNPHAMTALLWHAITDAKSRGLKLFDFEGSMDPGVERFFLGFGGRRALYMVLKKTDSMIWKLKEQFLG